jgi:ComF family protein
MRMAGIIDTLLRWVYPEDCAECQQPTGDRRWPSFCHACWKSIRALEGPICPCCGRPFDSRLALAHSPGHVCGPCQVSPPAYDRAFSPYRYEGVLAKAIHLYKYKHRSVLAAPLAQLMLVWQPRLPTCDIVLPVPLHPSRLRAREYNQALLLAAPIAASLSLPLSLDHLVRVRATLPQTALNRSERADNVRRAFDVRRPQELEDRRVLLIDDVLTTGSTVNECAKALRRAKAKAIVVLTLARRA